MAESEKKHDTKSAAPVESPMIEICNPNGLRNRHCREKDFAYFQQRGWKKVAQKSNAKDE